MTTIPDTDSVMPDSPDETLSLLRVQNALYRELESLALRQRSLISGGDTGPLLALLADRQKLASKLTSIAHRLEPIRRDWAERQKQLARAERGEAEKLLTETRHRLQRVIERDEEDARLLSARKRASIQALDAMHTTGQALSAYRAPSEGSVCLDRLDEDPS